MVNQNSRAARTVGARGFNELEFAHAQDFAANVITQSDPSKRRAHENQNSERSFKERQQKNHDEELRNH